MTENAQSDMLSRLEVLANRALTLWDLPAGASAQLINLSENAVYLVEAAGGFKAILRIHRVGYHTARAIESELAWLDALTRESAVATPGYIRGKDGRALQKMGLTGSIAPRYMVLFHFINGSAPAEKRDRVADFQALGGIAAMCHQHALSWKKPVGFERPTWDLDTILGAQPTWGHWRDAPEVTAEVRATLNEVERVLRKRLTSFGKSPGRFNLIHGDMRLANLLVAGNQIRLIDFDDCGWGWLLYDFAAAISFIEDDPLVPVLKAAWIKGYRAYRALSAEEAEEMDSLVMLRRISLLAWIGSHIEAPEPQERAPGFAAATAELGERYLAFARKSDGESTPR
ncbi:MAG: phosphotransferase [Pseudomonadota bacterium]